MATSHLPRNSRDDSWGVHRLQRKFGQGHAQVPAEWVHAACATLQAFGKCQYYSNDVQRSCGSHPVQCNSRPISPVQHTSCMHALPTSIAKGTIYTHQQAHGCMCSAWCHSKQAAAGEAVGGPTCCMTPRGDLLNLVESPGYVLQQALENYHQVACMRAGTQHSCVKTAA